jgi:Calcineurin-like phosphoesterase/IPT/TIG domain
MKKVAINRDRIKQVIYPTLGYPAIIKCGEQLTLEFDPRSRDWSKALPQITGFRVSVTTTNSAYPVTRVLPVKDFTVGFSVHWPEHSEDVEPRARVYLVTVDVPGTLPVHLYDLTITGTLKDGSVLTDSQPHALQVVKEYRTDYTFAHMTDIHVWGQEAAYIGSNTHERGWRRQEYSETEGYGATYYHKSIQQMNRARPDFLVYTGDYDFGLTWLYKQNYADFDAYKNSPWSDKYYETWFELDWFYTETLKLDVPVFMVPGNHDGWARYDQLNVSLEEDYLASWRALFGPHYFSFDYGPDNHFTAINSMDWTPVQRSLHWALPMALLGPHKWQGQVTAGGDQFEPGWTQEREDAVDDSGFTGQLRWVKRDLEAHASAKMKTMLLHHDPWKHGGSGSMFDEMAVIPDRVPFGGMGAGRLSLIKLARENKVAIVLSGHDHTDAYGSVGWEAGGGEVKFANTTSTQFQDGDRQNRWEYPGYRFIHVKDGEVENCYYQLASDASGAPLQYSWPFYAGTNVGGPNDLEALVEPAIDTAWSPRPGSATSADCTITNHLTGYEITPGGGWSGDLEGAFIEIPMPYLSGGNYYEVTNGTIGEVFDNATGDHRTCGVITDVSHAPGDGTATTRTVKVSKSASPDTEAPTCASFQIDGGAATTREAHVTLTNDAADSGGSGLLDMKIWNDGEAEDDAQWQRYQASVDWELQHQAGVRKVNIRFRDGAMPPNVSDVCSTTITMVGSVPTVTAVAPGAARVGDHVVIDGTGFGKSRTREGRVLFNDIAADVVSWSDARITCTVPYGVSTGMVTVFNDAGSVSSEFHVTPLIEMIVPDYGYNTGPIHIDNLEGTGFLNDGAAPDVKLTDGPVDISAKSVVVVSPQSITCDFDIKGATVGYYSVVVKNEDGYSYTLEGGLAVDSPPPTLTGIAPDNGKNAGTVDVTNLAGDNFLEGMRVWLVKGAAEIEAGNVVVSSPTRATCTFDVTGAKAGKWDVTVQNKDGKACTLPQVFTVQ